MSTSIDLLATLRAGLPASTGRPRHVVIVGAGMAGLTSAMLLKEAGHRVTILEARNRLGGRIYTYRGFAGGMYGEFGAMRFPRQHHLGQHLIHERFRLPTTPFPMSRRGHVHPPERPGASGGASSGRTRSTSRWRPPSAAFHPRT